ncbi:MAG: hypothetical protein DRJ61_08365 [Acidobacteria bacterium]|nr:MAG: hypothetical protein DRJ65_19135 [Acidobacteriota bacterium]RLE32934.1 MAG: hypothetical protein DRJ61_08365 [Acidobacteriota bacterium]
MIKLVRLPVLFLAPALILSWASTSRAGTIPPPTEGRLCENWRQSTIDLPIGLDGVGFFFAYEGGKYFLSAAWEYTQIDDFHAIPLFVSEDLVTWEQTFLPSDLDYKVYYFWDLAWNGEVYVGVVNDWRTTYISSDGIHWEPIESPPVGGGKRIVWTGEVFVTFDEVGNVSTSPDGRNWTWVSSVPTHYFTHFVSWSGTTWVVQCLFERFVSDDLIHWEDHSDDYATERVAWGHNRFIFRRQKQGSIFGVSADGRTLDSSTFPLDHDVWGYALTSPIFTGGGFSIVAMDSFDNEPPGQSVRLYFSKDGAHWQWEEFSFWETNFDIYLWEEPQLVWDGRHMAYIIVKNTKSPLPVSQEVLLFTGDCPALAGGGELPGMAHSEGSDGSTWRSDLWMLSDAAGEDEVVINYLPWNEPLAASRRRLVRVPGGRPFELNDVVGELFGEEGAGTVSVRPRTAALAVTARTWEEGTGNGQGIPPITEDDALLFNEKATLAGLSDSQSARTNIGLVNLGEAAITIRLDLRNEAGERLALRSVNLGPRESTQLNAPLRAAAGGADVEAGFAKVWTVTAGGRFSAYASRIDNTTNDPVFIRPSAVIPPMP